MKRLIVILAALALGACASLGLDQPKTLKQGLIAGEAQYHAAIDAIDDSLNHQEIGSIAAGNLIARADDANAILQDAKTAYQIACGAHDADPTRTDVCTDPTAQSKLALAVATLSGLQQYLRAQGAPK